MSAASRSTRSAVRWDEQRATPRWLPTDDGWRGRPRGTAEVDRDGECWTALVRLANARLDFVLTNALDKRVRRSLPDGPPGSLETKPVRLAPLGSATMAHLHGAIRVAGRSKKDEATALEPFDTHPAMVPRRSAIACFVPNWQDKACNIHRIAAELNIGSGALVFVDDPFERTLVREQLPVVAPSPTMN